VIVIAGGSYGLGRAIARQAAAKGANVVDGARTAEALAGPTPTSRPKALKG
jgi:NAD(P)-dependent dehydrogenase (short-subunit alcohol dehydrogenase family)